MAEELQKHGHKLCTDGTDNHLILWDLRPEGLTGSKVEKTADMCRSVALSIPPSLPLSLSLSL